jgi:hypothetical protein
MPDVCRATERAALRADRKVGDDALRTESFRGRGLKTMKTPSKARNFILAALVAALASCGDSKPTAAEFKRHCETELGGDFSIMSTVDGDFGVCAVNHTPVETEPLA